MALENMFIAAAVWLTGMLGFFMFLLWYLKGEFWKKLALTGCFAVMSVSMEMMRRGWQNFVVSNELAGIAEVVYSAVFVGMILSFFGMGLTVFLDTFQFLIDAVRGKRSDFKADKMKM